MHVTKNGNVFAHVKKIFRILEKRVMTLSGAKLKCTDQSGEEACNGNMGTLNVKVTLPVHSVHLQDNKDKVLKQNSNTC